ncbi:MAG: hypothetical protein GXO32_02390 [Crenarchaeota archaeon]|nr:hypothetical protein [Thermoproteota archaeon]
MAEALDRAEIEEEIRIERRKNLEDIIRWARWNAEMVLRHGLDWSSKWVEESWRATMEALKNPEVRRAAIEAIKAIDRAKIERLRRTGDHDLWFYDD